MVKNGSKWSKMVQNGRPWSKSPKMVKIAKIGQNRQNGLKFSKMVKNGGPDLKRARSTGLSARRARRTKSIGPMGLQLQVMAQRAPQTYSMLYI